MTFSAPYRDKISSAFTVNKTRNYVLVATVRLDRFFIALPLVYAYIFTLSVIS